jgi:Bacterial transglutaminase-like N-terminal region
MTVDAADKSAVLRLTPQSGVGQEVKQSHLSIEPQVNLYEFHDAFGNLLQRIMLGQGRSIITSTCTVDT